MSISVRSKSWSWTKPIACSTWASSATCAASSPCCPAAVRTCSSRPLTPTRSAPGGRPARAAGRDRVARRNSTAEGISQHVYRVDKDAKRDLLVHLIVSGSGTRPWCSRAPSTGRIASVNNSYAPASKLPPSMATRASQRARAHWPVSRAAPSTSSSPPTSRPVAWISTACPTWSTTSSRRARGLRPSHRAYRARGESGSAISLVAADEHGLLRDIQRLLKRELPVLPLPATLAAGTPRPAAPQPAAREGAPGPGTARRGPSPRGCGCAVTGTAQTPPAAPPTPRVGQRAVSQIATRIGQATGNLQRVMGVDTPLGTADQHVFED